MTFQNLRSNKIAVHEVFKKDSNGPVQPRLSNSLESLDKEATRVFCSRVTDAMGSASRSVEMAILNYNPGSAFFAAKSILTTTSDNEFILISQEIAHMLSRAQTSMIHPGGLLMVFTGITDTPEKRFVGLLKAEPQNGFRQEIKNGRSILEFLNKLFLTPDSKVYKIGMFIEKDQNAANQFADIDIFRCYLFDANMTSKETAKAATYFYQSFLGLKLLSEDAHTTRKFVEVTRQFIDGTNFDEETKYELRSALITYVKTNKNATISLNEFGKLYLPDDDVRDSYERYGLKRHLPDRAFTRDLKECKTLFKRRRIKFGNDVQLSGPAEKFSDLIELKTIEGNEKDKPWTQITIKTPFLGEK